MNICQGRFDHYVNGTCPCWQDPDEDDLAPEPIDPRLEALEIADQEAA